MRKHCGFDSLPLRFLHCRPTWDRIPESAWYRLPTSGLNGPYNLTSTGIAANVTRTSPGAYALGELKDGTFHIHYVGRADDDVAGRLGDHVSKWYPHFKFGYFNNSKAAFEAECRLYHDFDPPDNKVHPAKPANSNYSCPHC